MITPNTIGSISNREWFNDYSVYLDGNSQACSAANYEYISDTSSGGKSLTVWVYFDTFVGNNTVICWAQDTSVYSNSGFWNFRIWRNATYTSNQYRLGLQRRVGSNSTSPANILFCDTVISTGTWYLLSITTDSYAHSMYVNTTAQTVTLAGAAGGSAGAAGDWWGDCNLDNQPDVLNFGAAKSLAAELNGYYTQAVYWDGQLTASEISEYYNGGTPMDCRLHSRASIIRNQWRFGDDDTYNYIKDRRANSDLDMVGMTAGAIGATAPQ